MDATAAGSRMRISPKWLWRFAKAGKVTFTCSAVAATAGKVDFVEADMASAAATEPFLTIIGTSAHS